jgi:hypothetical protein
MSPLRNVKRRLRGVLLFALLSTASGLLVSDIALAEDEDAPPEGVQYDLHVGAVFSQTNYVDWAEGGDDALSYAARLLAGISEDRINDKWKIEGEAKFGQSKVGGENTRVSVNEFTIDAQYNYKLPERWSAYAATGLRSPIVTGYDYKVPIPGTDPQEYEDVEKASFNDPGYYEASLGAEKDISSKPYHFTSRLGVGLRYTTARVHFEFGYADDPDTPELDKTKLETGFDSVTELNAEITEEITLVSKLQLFSTFEGLDVWDVRWENMFTARINKYVNTYFQFDFLFDKDVSGRLQRFQMLSIGLSYTII